MRIIRNNIFETNSSSTHSLVMKKIPSKLPKRKQTKNWKGELLPVTYDNPNIRIEVRKFYDNTHGKGENKDLNHIEYMASYLFTALLIMRNHEMYYKQHYKGEENLDVEVIKARRQSEVDALLERFHKLLLDLGLKPQYSDVVYEYTMYDYNYNSGEGKAYEDSPEVSLAYELKNAYMEANDGTDFDGIKAFQKILKNKESLKKYLTKQSIKIRYRG